MQTIISWLIGIEDSARRFYEKAAIQFEGDDEDLVDLLNGLAADERHHYESVKGAYEVIKDKEVASPIKIDRETQKGLEDYFAEAFRMLEAGELTKDKLISAIVDIEYSECNDVFLFIINSLKPFPGIYAAASEHIKKHTLSIEKYIEDKPEYLHLVEKIRKIPNYCRSSFLVVDDEKAMINIFSVLLGNDGIVESAFNGKEALKKLESKSFDAIISDIDMPEMNGIEFYNKASEMYPMMSRRFLFLTGSYDENRLNFFRDKNLRFLIKPASIKDIKKALHEIMISEF